MLTSFLIILGLFLGLNLVIKTRRKNLPPGPKGLPIIGNALDLPSSEESKTYARWGEAYGPVASANVFGQTIVILNKSKDAVNLLEGRGNNYAGRVLPVMAGVLSGWGGGLLFQTGSRAREMRRIIHSSIGTKAFVARFEGVEEAAAHAFLCRVIRAPHTLQEEARRFAAQIILKITYGHDLQGLDDPLLKLVDDAMLQFSEVARPGVWLVDIIPSLQHIPSWFPGASFKKKAIAFKSSTERMVKTPFLQVKEALKNGTASQSLTADTLQDSGLNLEPESERVIEWTAASMYSGAPQAGADTTVATICAFYLAMTLHPEAQKRAQAEIDAVVGTERLPIFSDRERLPYVQALYLEVLRWHVVAPLGLPHVATRDDQYEGYAIPNGALVIANIWNMLHDSDEYQDPSVFNPNRFLSTEGRKSERDPREICFGFGRRICPGRNLADSSVWLSCCLALATLDITKAIVGGQIVEPVVKFSDGVISHPLPFVCDIKPRSPKAEALVNSHILARDTT